MKNKFIAWFTIFVISFMPILPWYFLGPDANHSTNLGDLMHSSGQLAGLIGMTMFALTFILSTRIKKIEDFFGGLDKVYLAHCLLGGIAFFLILFHPIFLVLKFIPSNIKLAAEYLLPSSSWPVNFGIIALLGMIILLYLTFYIRIKYHIWKFSHKFLGVFFILAVLHIFLIRGSASRDYIFAGYYFYVAIVSVIGLSGFFYSLFLKDRSSHSALYTIKEIKTRAKNEDIKEIILEPENKPIKYKSGQFVFLRFYNKNLGKESHPFSIASKSDDYSLSVIIKNLGDFTSKLSHLSLGEKVSVEGPYGRFNHYRKSDVSQIWIAGGIGVTPFIGIAADFAQNKNMLGNVEMYYSVKNEEDLIGVEFFKSVQNKTNGKFKVIPWISGKQGRLTIQDIIKKSGELKNKEFYMCGPGKLKESLTKDLINSGISRSKIFTEEFDFREG